MRYKGLDLNLLGALEILLTERNVSQASLRLNLTQSATSSALARLREQLDDELLVPAGRSFSLSPYAELILPRIRAILKRIELDVLEKSGNDPADAARLVRIMASDYVSLVSLGPGLAEIARVAPKLSFKIIRVTDTPGAAIDNYSIDLLIAPDVFISKRHPSAEFFRDDYVALFCAENSDVDTKMNLETFMSMPHVTVHFEQNGNPMHDDRFFQRMGHLKTQAISVPSHALIPYFLIDTKRISVVQKRQAIEFCKRFPLQFLPVPGGVPKITEMLQWHSANNDDKTLLFVRNKLVSFMSNSIDL